MLPSVIYSKAYEIYVDDLISILKDNAYIFVILREMQVIEP